MPSAAPSLRVDFQNADVPGRVRLTTVGTREDIAAHGLTLTEGLAVALTDAELSAEGIVRWSDAEGIWVAELTSKVTES